MPPPPPDWSRPEESPLTWFGEMLLAVDRGDFQRAADAQIQLARLGWVVRYRKPRSGREGDRS